MSQHIFTDKGTFVLLGYDRPLDYVFCVIERDGETVYCNLDDDNAGIDLQDVNYFRPIIAEHGITLPEEMFEGVEADQRERVGNKVIEYPQKGNQ